MAIGAAIGVAAAAYYPFTFQNAALYVTIASFSALSADLDGTSMLSSKIGKASKLLREVLLWGGILLAAIMTYLYFARDYVDITLSSVAVMGFLIGFISKEGVIRNALVSSCWCRHYRGRLVLEDELVNGLRFIRRLGALAQAQRNDAYGMGDSDLGNNWIWPSKPTPCGWRDDRIYHRLCFPFGCRYDDTSRSQMVLSHC